MTKEEACLSVMGAVSMALNDPILQQGFEIICKNLTDHEKEIAELKEKINILDNCDRLGDVITEEYKDQLTKAKELLKRYVPYRQITDSKAYKDLADETEKFLEEIEK